MRFGVKQKIIGVLVAVLILTTALNVTLASWLTNHQNQDAAFADLDRGLNTWSGELESQANQLHDRALAVLDDAAVKQQLSQVVALNADIEDPLRSKDLAEMARTLGYAKTVSLNQLDLALRTGGISSIAVYTGDQLSHYVSEAGAGIRVIGSGGQPLWLSTAAGGAAGLPIQTWPAWKPAGPPSAVAAGAHLDAPQPIVSFAFLPQGDAAIDVSVPIHGDIEKTPTDILLPAPYVRFVSRFGVAAAGGGPTPPHRLATVVFRKIIRAADLQDLAKKTGKTPYLISLDGPQRIAPAGAAPMPAWFLQPAKSASGSSAIIRRILNDPGGSVYADAAKWSYAGAPRFLLVLTSSRAHTLRNIEETVWSIVMVSALIAVLSIGLAVFWISRFVDPIIALTRAVKRIRLEEHDADGARRAIGASDLRPVDVRAPDEIGELALAFKLLLTELRESFEMLEERVRSRTAELRRRTLYMQTLLDTLPLWAWLKDTGGRYLAVNEACAQAAGVESPEDLVGKSDTEFWEPEQAEHIKAEDRAVLATRERRVVERQDRIRGDDTTAWIETFRAPVLDDDGAILGIVGVARNVSEQKAAEAAREAALAEALRLVQARSEFMAQMSHELRTPLNAILGYAQTLQNDPDLTQRQVRGLGTIRSSGEHLLTLINDILDLARIDAAKLKLEISGVSLTSLLSAVGDMFSVRAEEKSLSFNCDFAPDLPRAVRCDGTRLRQVLINLVGNAVKFTDQGAVTLRVCTVTAQQDKAAGAADSASVARVRFEVEDSGIGMTPEQAARIFEPFEQVTQGDRRREGGAGLGLAISRKLVMLMGGEIRVRSEPGKGSLFWFELDLPVVADLAALPQSAGSRLVGYEGPQKKILVADDAAHNRAVLVDALTSVGFAVAEAVDGKDAIDQAIRWKPDVILMDVMMPVVDGVETARSIRRSPELGGVPIVGVTASANAEVEAACREAGMNDFIAKPIDHRQLVRVIGELLGLSWIYEAEDAPVEVSAPHPADLAPPPPDELDRLYQLAIAGNMRPILKRAEYLMTQDPRYAAFARRLKALAEDFQSKAVLALIERHRGAVDV